MKDEEEKKKASRSTNGSLLPVKGSLNPINKSLLPVKGSLNPMGGSLNPGASEQKARVGTALNNFFGSMDRTSASGPTSSGVRASAAGSLARAPAAPSAPGSGPSPLTAWPRAFRAIADKVNELCGWWAGLRAGPGIAISKSKGATIISLAGPKGAASESGPSTELHYSDASITIDIDSAGVVLTNLSTGAIAKFYTTGAIGVVDGAKEVLISPSDNSVAITNGTKYVNIDEDGVSALNPGSSASFVGAGFSYGDSGIAIIGDANGFKLINNFTGDYVKMYTTGAFGVVNGGTAAELLISPADITHDMSVREVDVCVDGEAKKMLIVASEPYAAP